MAIYESMLVFSGRLEPQEVEDQITKVTGLIETDEGSLHSIERMGRRRLAYEIRKDMDGYYAVFHYENDPSRIASLERAWRLDELILRHVVIRREKFPDGPTVAVEESAVHAAPEPAPVKAEEKPAEAASPEKTAETPAEATPEEPETAETPAEPETAEAVTEEVTAEPAGEEEEKKEE